MEVKVKLAVEVECGGRGQSEAAGKGPLESPQIRQIDFSQLHFAQIHFAHFAQFLEIQTAVHPVGIAHNILSRVFTLIPTTCMVCNRHCHRDFNLCTACEEQLPVIGSHCLRCGLPCAESVLQQGYCGNCLGGQFAVDSCHGLFHYSSPVNKLLSAFKFNERLDVGYAFARLLAEAMARHYQTQPAPDLLIPVPIHYLRYLQRGFNQSWELTKEVSRRTGLSACHRHVIKQRHTQPQSALPQASKRRRNLSGAFAMGEKIRPGNVAGVTIIDDVVTTMSTASTLAKLLKSQGIQRVEVWCIARASKI